MRFDIITLFPDMVRAVLGESIIGRGEKAGFLDIRYHHIREYSKDKHRNVDDTPYGGGVGMLLTCQPIADAVEAARADVPKGAKVRTIYLSPRGKIFNHEKAVELSSFDRLIFICGHYEGIDQRIIDEYVDEEISVGDYVLTGGELPACIVADAVARLVPGVLDSAECWQGESIASGILEYPQYTHPRVFHGREVPEVLLSGDHAKIDRFRLEAAVAVTKERRPDLLLLHPEYEEMLKPKVKKSKKKSEQ